MSKNTTLRWVNKNGNQGGGNKKSGLKPTATSQCIATTSPNGPVNYSLVNNTKLSCVNQLGGIGRFRSQFNVNADGKRCNKISNKILEYLNGSFTFTVYNQGNITFYNDTTGQSGIPYPFIFVDCYLNSNGINKIKEELNTLNAVLIKEEGEGEEASTIRNFSPSTNISLKRDDTNATFTFSQIIDIAIVDNNFLIAAKYITPLPDFIDNQDDNNQDDNDPFRYSYLFEGTSGGGDGAVASTQITIRFTS